MEVYIPLRPDGNLLLGSQTSIWPSWDVVFHESTFKLQINSELPLLWLQGTVVA